MPSFTYRAKSFTGQSQQGTLEAKDEKDLARILHQQGLVLIFAQPAEKKSAGLKLGSLTQGLFGVPLTDKLMLTKNLQVMVQTGVSLPKALQILSLQAKSRKFKRILADISENLTRGQSFSDAIAQYPDTFSEIYFHMVKVGEESGTLAESLKNLASQMEKEHELKSKVKGALIYPAVILSVMLAVAILMLTTVTPKLAQVFKDLQVDLPPTTLFVMNLGTFLAAYWYLALLVLLLTVLALRLFFTIPQGQRLKDRLLLELPLVGPLIKKVNASYLSRTLAVLTSSGVSFVRSIEIVANLLPNVYYKQAMRQAIDQVQKGAKLSQALTPYGALFPPAVIQMLQVGEETGETSKILTELAEFFEQEVASETKNLVSVIEPLLMVFLGAVVGFFAISMIQPIYSMLGTV